MEESAKLAQAKNKQKLLLIFTIIFAVLFVAFALIVKFIDVRTIGPNESAVGLAGVNEAVHNALPYNELWHRVTKLSGYAIYLPPIFFAILFLVQLIRRKSFQKIDRELKLAAVYIVAVLAVYFAFDHLIIINYRPVLIDGVLEPSFPSSHTLFAISLCGASALLVSRYLKLKHKAFFVTLLILLALFNIIGRLISGVHWATDIFGGILIGHALLAAFATALMAKSPKAKTKTE